MKTLFLKHKIFSIATLLILSISLNGCSDDEDVITFLDNHANTNWKLFDNGVTSYAKFSNDVKNPIEIWSPILGVNCYFYAGIDELGDFEILENSTDELVVKLVDDPQEYVIISFKVSGDLLTVSSKFYEEGALDDEEISIYRQTSDILEDLEICTN